MPVAGVRPPAGVVVHFFCSGFIKKASLEKMARDRFKILGLVLQLLSR